MSTHIELTEPTFCIPGSIGPPGKRVFYLQAAEDEQVISLRLEKQQVAALATYLSELLTDLPTSDESESAPTSLIEPVVAEWVVGAIGVGYRDDSDRIVVALEELTDAPLDDAPDDEASRARIHLTRSQAAHLVATGARLVASGRSPCPLCGKPIDADGHTCIKSNGHGHS